MGNNYYKYNGNDFTVTEPKPRHRPPLGIHMFNPSLCGTNAGYHQHFRHAQPRCEPCIQAHRDYDAGYRARRKAA
jgi:hypothetical protein